MYSKISKHFSKESLVSISSESSKVHLLIKVLYRHIQFNLCRRYLLFHTLNVSLVLLASVQLYVLAIRPLDTKYFSCAIVITRVLGVTHISNLPTVCVKMILSSRPTHCNLHVKMTNLPKIDVYNFRYKIRVGILMKLFFLSHKCINK